MTKQFSARARTAAAIISLAAFAALGAQIAINEGSALEALASMMRFFTIWSNLAAAVLLGWVALGRRVAPQVLFSLATALALVGLVYHLLLAADHHPTGADWYTNQMHHTVIPLATIGWWLGFSDTRATGWRTLPVVIAVPLIYTMFALIVGEQTGFYPYFFLDLPHIGWRQLLVNVAGLGAVFMAFGAMLMGLRKLITARV